MNSETLITELKRFPLNQYGIFDPNIISFSQEVKNMCAMNTCGKYGTNWQCPPAVGELNDNKNECLKFKNALMFNTVWPLEDSFDFEGMADAGGKHREITLEIKELIKEVTDAFLLLGAGGCSICKKCAYLTNEPCRFPDKTIASMEAYGISVIELCPASGFKYINGANTVTYFSLILF